MTNQAAFSVNVDVTNPGHFFACCGLLELANRVWPGTEGWFENEQFSVSTADATASLKCMLLHLATANATALPGSVDPKLPPVRLGSPFELRIDWWLDQRGDKTVFGKMFSGQKRTLKDVTRLQRALTEQLHNELDELHVFDWSAPLKGRFGVDPRAAWEALDVGFSPNEQGMEVTTYTVVELLGAIGLQTAPPIAKDSDFFYRTWTQRLPACVARAAAAGVIPIVGQQFCFALTRRGSYKGFDYAIATGG